MEPRIPEDPLSDRHDTTPGAHTRVAQLVFDCHDCAGPVDDPALLERMLHQAAERVGATVLQVSRCDYVPHGVTMIAFLAESHLLVTTWPEHRYAIVEVMLCNEHMDPRDAHAVILDVLRPESIDEHEIVHRMRPHRYS